MSFELIHASVAKGLDGGSGFATVVATAGLPQPLEAVLKELSAYDFDPSRAVGADRVDHAHRIVTVQGSTWTVVSRIAPCGSDASGRPNRIAHHLVVEQSERAAAGPAALIAAYRSFAQMPPAVERRARGPALPTPIDEPPRPADAWTQAGFDAGFAGLAARMLLDQSPAPIYLVFTEEVDALPLVDDIVMMLPAERRWLVTFSTRFLRASASVRCQLRCVREGAPGVASLLAEPGARHLVVRRGAEAGASAAADAAREGRALESAVPRLAPPNPRVDPRLDRTARTAPASRSGRVAEPPEAGSDAFESWEPPRAASAAIPQHAPIEPAYQANRRPPLSLLALTLFFIAGASFLASFILAVLLMLGI